MEKTISYHHLLGDKKYEYEKGETITWGDNYMRQHKIIVEKHSDGYVAYPLGLKGVVVGQGDTYEEALTLMKKHDGGLQRCWEGLRKAPVSKDRGVSVSAVLPVGQ